MARTSVNCTFSTRIASIDALLPAFEASAGPVASLLENIDKFETPVSLDYALVGKYTATLSSKRVGYPETRRELVISLESNKFSGIISGQFGEPDTITLKCHAPSPDTSPLLILPSAILSLMPNIAKLKTELGATLLVSLRNGGKILDVEFFKDSARILCLQCTYGNPRVDPKPYMFIK
jgi:hypothetical protein